MCTGQESCVVTFCLHLQVDSGGLLARNLAAKSRWFLNIWFWREFWALRTGRRNWAWRKRERVWARVSKPSPSMHMQVLAIISPAFLHFFCELSYNFISTVAFSSIERSVDLVDEFVDYCVYIKFASLFGVRGADFFKIAMEEF